MCGIAVSSSPTVCGFSPFRLTVFGKRRSFTVLQYHLFALSCLIQVNTMCSTNHSKLNRLIKVNIHRTLDLRVNDWKGIQWLGFSIVVRSMGAIHSTKIPTGPTGKSGLPQKVDQFFRSLRSWRYCIVVE